MFSYRLKTLEEPELPPPPLRELLMSIITAAPIIQVIVIGSIIMLF